MWWCYHHSGTIKILIEIKRMARQCAIIPKVFNRRGEK